jgi:hypothetical protein
MARPKKKGLDYFPLDIDFFSDNKIRILKARFGADGITIYVYLLCEIYKNGYYIKVDDDFQYIMSDELHMSIDKVKQVLKFLLERSLFDSKLFQSDTILTSAGIQERFQLAIKERARKNPIKITRFWLLSKEETEPFIKVTHFDDISQNNSSYSRKNSCNSPEKSLKKSKVNKYIYYSNRALEEEFLCYLDMRNHMGPTLTNEQIAVLKEELDRIGETEEEKIAICRKAFASGWKSFYPIKRQKKKGAKPERKGNSFHNFQEREYDYDDLQRRLAERSSE